MIQIYTDGACVKNPGGTGGWAYLIYDGESKVLAEASGYVEATTSNRMEILAVALGIIAASKLNITSFTVFSDSQYVVNTLTKDWQKKANTDLWAVIEHSTSRLDVQYEWIKGHNNHPENTQADKLAQAAAKYKKSTNVLHPAALNYLTNNQTIIELPF